MRVVVAFIHAEGKSMDEIKKLIQDTGLKLHDIALVRIAERTHLE